jgi:hypothetical protein
VVFCGVIVVSLYAEGFFTGPSPRTKFTDGNLGGSVNSNGTRTSFKAALIDGLSDAGGDEGFAGSVNKTLQEAGFSVDVYQGREVTVDLLEEFACGYRLVIFRVHSALSDDKELFLFTAEPYSNVKYSQEQYSGLVRKAYATENSQPVFAVNWGFVKRLMTGEFNGTLVVMMGCDGTKDPLITWEFFAQGAVGYVGWNGPVLLSHSDKAILCLIQDLYVDGQSLRDAVADTNSQVGQDPVSASVLECSIP